ncbi:MAG TPA: ATP-binding protein, partial [Acidobacteriota bacterium]|nr:ATP-binding protein [Acidobacteriota bacterium]
DSAGHMIACQTQAGESEEQRAPPDMAAAARIGRPVVRRYRAADGAEMLGALSWIEPLGWGVLAERDAEEAFGPLDRWRFLIVGAVLVVIGFGFALSTILGNRMMRQLEVREMELRSTHEQLITADRLASVGMMAASIAHEVNNPLTTIKVMIHSVHERIADGDEVREDLRIAQGEIDKIKVLVLRFLQFARPREPEFATIHVNDIMQRVLALVRPQAQSRSIALQESYDQHLPPVWADGPQLGQAFLNILFNALEATPQDGEIRVTTTELDNGNVSVRIWNSGPSLSPDLAEQVFEPFFSTKATGTGLGLPIARIIVDKHHGAITAEGHGERGTSFFITLPRVDPGGNDGPRIGG